MLQAGCRDSVHADRLRADPRQPATGIVRDFEVPNAGGYVQLVIALELNQDGKSRWRLVREVNADFEIRSFFPDGCRCRFRTNTFPGSGIHENPGGSGLGTGTGFPEQEVALGIKSAGDVQVHSRKSVAWPLFPARYRARPIHQQVRVMSNARISRFDLDRADVAASPKLRPKNKVPENIRSIGRHFDGFGRYENGIRPPELPIVPSLPGRDRRRFRA